MMFGQLRGNEELVIEAPVQTNQAEYTMVNLNEPKKADESYACEFKGHTAIEVKPVAEGAGNDYYHKEKSRDWYRLYRREGMRSNQAPIKKASAYVHPPKLVKWWTL